MTIVHLASCLFLYLTIVHFQGELQHGGDVSQQKIKFRPIRTREIGSVSLSDVLYVWPQSENENLGFPLNWACVLQQIWQSGVPVGVPVVVS